MKEFCRCVRNTEMRSEYWNHVLKAKTELDLNTK